MESKDLPVEKLRLDPENPRLPEPLVGATDVQNLLWLNEEAVLNELAASMVENGFFRHEPLIVLKPKTPDGDYIVVEGNRRFAALTILLQLPIAEAAELEFDFQIPPTDEQLDRLRSVPCFIVEDKNSVRKFLGFRHIGGVRTWSPEAKARYLDTEVQLVLAAGSKNAFRDVGRLVGSNAAGVRGPYIALHILRAARDLYDIDTNYVLQNRFGVWNRMMNSKDLRAYIGFGEATTAEEVLAAVEHMDAAKLAEVLGDLTPSDGQRSAVLADSRDVTTYAMVVNNERARETLRTYLDLGLAKQVIDRANLAQKIRNVTRTIEVLIRDIEEAEPDEELLSASRALLAQARTLNGGIRTRVEPDDDD